MILFSIYDTFPAVGRMFVTFRLYSRLHHSGWCSKHDTSPWPLDFFYCAQRHPGAERGLLLGSPGLCLFDRWLFESPFPPGNASLCLWLPRKVFLATFLCFHGLRTAKRRVRHMSSGAHIGSFSQAFTEGSVRWLQLFLKLAWMLLPGRCF